MIKERLIMNILEKEDPNLARKVIEELGCINGRIVTLSYIDKCKIISTMFIAESPHIKHGIETVYDISGILESWENWNYGKLDGWSFRHDRGFVLYSNGTPIKKLITES